MLKQAARETSGSGSAPGGQQTGGGGGGGGGGRRAKKTTGEPDTEGATRGAEKSKGARPVSAAADTEDEPGAGPSARKGGRAAAGQASAAAAAAGLGAGGRSGSDHPCRFCGAKFGSPAAARQHEQDKHAKELAAKKQQVCKTFKATGQCRYGDNCRHAHGSDQPAPRRPAAGPSGSAAGGSRFVCAQCGGTFRKKHAVRQHIRDKHGDSNSDSDSASSSADDSDDADGDDDGASAMDQLRASIERMNTGPPVQVHVHHGQAHSIGQSAPTSVVITSFGAQHGVPAARAPALGPSLAPAPGPALAPAAAPRPALAPAAAPVPPSVPHPVELARQQARVQVERASALLRARPRRFSQALAGARCVERRSRGCCAQELPLDWGQFRLHQAATAQAGSLRDCFPQLSAAVVRASQTVACAAARSHSRWFGGCTAWSRGCCSGACGVRGEHR
jgi:hypothetical protein